MIKPDNKNSEFQLGGINHVALVCSDMQKTVDFYSGVLGMPLIKSLDLPGGMGQHFFFDAGNGDCVAFFWFANAADRVPGISSPAAIPGIGEITSSVSSMNHLAFHVPAEKFDEYRQRLKDKGVRVGPVLNHDESEAQVSPTVHPGVYVRSFYFHDPDGITLEFACWVKGIHRGRHADPAQDRSGPATVGDCGLVKIESGIVQRVENRGELVDELLLAQVDLTGEPGADGLTHATDDEVDGRSAPAGLVSAQRRLEVLS